MAPRPRASSPLGHDRLGMCRAPGPGLPDPALRRPSVGSASSSRGPRGRRPRRSVAGHRHADSARADRPAHRSPRVRHGHLHVAGGLRQILPDDRVMGCPAAPRIPGMVDAQAFTAPVPTTSDLILLAVAGAGLAALCVDTLFVSVRSPLLAGIPILVLFAGSTYLQFGRAPWWTFPPAAAAWLLILAADQRDWVREWGRVPAHDPDPRPVDTRSARGCRRDRRRPGRRVGPARSRGGRGPWDRRRRRGRLRGRRPGSPGPAGVDAPQPDVVERLRGRSLSHGQRLAVVLPGHDAGELRRRDVAPACRAGERSRPRLADPRDRPDDG